MPKIRNLAELESIRCQAQHSLSMQQKKVLVCCGTGCIAGGFPADLRPHQGNLPRARN